MGKKADISGEGRVLGIDFGSKRIGLSLSDPLRIIASSYATIANSPALWEELSRVIDKEGVVLVVVGMPLTLKGLQGDTAREVSLFIEELRRKSHCDVVTWDERFTTSIAQQSLREMGGPRKQRRPSAGRVDAMAAAIMLQGFLDRTKKSVSC